MSRPADRVQAARLDAATGHLDAPFAAIDLDALDANADALVRRAGGVDIRLASKSVRCRPLIDSTLGRPGWSGVMAYSLAEALWLVEHGADDVLVAYPSVDGSAWARLSADHEAAARIAVVVDSPEQLDMIDRLRTPSSVTLRLCLDVDSSLRVGPVHLGVRRSPVHTSAEAGSAARAIAARPGMELVGLMFYDAQIAGLPDSSPAVRWIKRRSAAELRRRRSAVVAAVSAHAQLAFVNGGGTGSLHVTGQDPALTELAAGSGLYGPTLFDGYRDFSPVPAAFFALPVVRRPSRSIVTAFGGGYIASGPAGAARVPLPWWPAGLRLLGTEGAGEVQTPLRGRAASSIGVGDRIWFRHAKAGELCERFDALHLVRGDAVVETVPTYRGEGRNFG